ncbi:MAG: CHASE3 domain-containing protein [Hymenobacteraceae bacterium]|nr:CHASE3 domain-containing protein [Hymenobacteraceae bacterium]MDX5395809.1 CHASE3 domain-containing protein [Hymenobacteraceae bacterium]MDX5442948.1 CHASE3 domain-containing protein [Hymenobacteraceae bacterium]MDX5511864.1 CHASE3 domain-containing protein [Hymenobacteraceae bacterium]
MNLSTKVFAGFVLISFIFTAVAIVNFRLSEDVIENSRWVSRSQIIIRNSGALQRNIIDMETGLRGYLLTGNDSFLEPYISAEKQIPVYFTQIRKNVKESPEQLHNINKIEDIHSRWVTDFARPLLEAKRYDVKRDSVGTAHFGNIQSMMSENGRKMMDSMRVNFKDFNSIEYRIREERNQKLNESIDNTRHVSSTLTLISVLLGIGWAFYITRIISGRIMKMVNLADRISKGDYKIQIHDTAHDELSKLSASLDLMAKTIEETITELERKNKELDQFAYVVSHDLKAPLRGIENASRWVEEDMGKDLPPHIHEYLMMMRVRVHRMENLINGILALARIGRIQQIEEEVDVKQLIYEIIDMLDPPKGFEIYVPDSLPVIFTVRIQLQQVFSNLISNAIKYHNKEVGHITIQCHETNQYFVFSVTDDGPGIDPEYHDRIFVIFQTLQERDAVESTGVGLAIVKKIIERQGGSIRVISAPGEGSTFTFTWPKEKVLEEIY